MKKVVERGIGFSSLSPKSSPIIMIYGTIFVAILGVISQSFAASKEPNSSSQNSTASLPKHLSLEEALALFRQRGFDLRLANATILSAYSDTLSASAVANPTLGITYGRTFGYNADVANEYNSPNQGGCPGCSANTFGISITDNYAIFDTLLGKRSSRMLVARKALSVAQLTKADTQRLLELQVKQQYVQIAFAQAALNFSKEVQKALNESVRLNKLRYPKVIDEGTLARVEITKLGADQAVDLAIQNVRSAKLGLAFLLSVREANVDFDIDAEALKFSTPSRLAQATEESLVRLALLQRPDLQVTKALHERAEAAIAASKRQRLPDIGITAAYTMTGTGQNALQPPTLLFSLSFTIPSLYRYEGEIRKAEADRMTQTVQQQKLQAQIITDVGNAYAAFTTNRKLVERMESSMLERAKRARDITKLQFEAGAAPLMDFLDAQRTFIATNVEYLQNQLNYWNSLFQLEQAVGVDLRK